MPEPEPESKPEATTGAAAAFVEARAAAKCAAGDVCAASNALTEEARAVRRKSGEHALDLRALALASEVPSGERDPGDEEHGGP